MAWRQTQQTGAHGEDLALAHLLRHGLKLVERNFRVRGGEIDLICRQGEQMVFVEVKTRTNAAAAFGGAAAAVTPAKQKRLLLAAQHWFARHGEKPCRFDCVLIEGGALEWIKDAFRPA